MWSTGQTSVCTGGSRNSRASSCWLMEGGSNLSIYAPFSTSPSLDITQICFLLMTIMIARLVVIPVCRFSCRFSLQMRSRVPWEVWRKWTRQQTPWWWVRSWQQDVWSECQNPEWHLSIRVMGEAGLRYPPNVQPFFSIKQVISKNRRCS